jgi:sugar lactone lactonase YvrE
VAEVSVFDGRTCRLGEGPHYDERTGWVVWVDILGSRIVWRDLAGAEVGETPTAGHVGAAVPRRDGGLVLCLPTGPVLADPDGTVRPLGTYAEADAAVGVPPSAEAPALRSNDAKADPAGRLWLGTMTYDQIPGRGALYRLDPGAGVPRRILGDVTISNGLGWSPDRATMYYVDTPTRRIDAFAYDIDTGELGERSPFATIEGTAEGPFPDGLCVDADGGVWVALWNGSAVRRYTPDGRLDRVVDLPTPLVTSCAFAGEEFTTLVITTAAGNWPADDHAGRTYAYEPGDVVGRPVDRYAG